MVNKRDFSCRTEKPTGREPVLTPTCPFCGLPFERPKELPTRRPGEMPVGSCSCGAVYAYDATGHNLGAAFIEALVFGCNMDWDLAWNLIPEEDYLEGLVENYDGETHLVVPSGMYEGRRIPGALYFIKLHQDIQEVTRKGVQQKLSRALPPPEKAHAVQPPGRKSTRRKVEELVRQNQIESLQSLAGKDKKIINDLQRLLYSSEELLRFKAAEALGIVAATVAQRDPGTVSRFLQGLLSSISDTGSSNWGAIDAAGEIIANSPATFAGYLPALLQLLDDDMLRPSALRAIGRVARARPDLVRKSAYRLMPYLRDPVPETQGYAALLFSYLSVPEARSDLERLLSAENEVDVYEDGKIKKKIVSELASEALSRL